MQKNRQIKRVKRAARVRHNLAEVAGGKLRLSVFRSNMHMYGQIIDDKAGTTLVSASTVDKKLSKEIKNPDSIEAAALVGKALAERAKAAGVSDVYFDRGGVRYMGRVKALADAARAGGLKF